MIRVALFGAETILMVWHPRLPVPLPLLALDGGSTLVLERTPKYRTLNTPNIECLNMNFPNITFWPKIKLRTCQTSQNTEQFEV